MGSRIVFVFVLIVLAAGGGWALYHFKLAKHLRTQSPTNLASVSFTPDPDAWNRAVETAKADRAGVGAGALEIPSELKHYEERYWFLATQVAEIEKYNIPSCQDYLDLAATIERGEMVPVPAVTDTYVLLGIGQRADDSPFSRYEEDKDLLDQNSNRNNAGIQQRTPAEFDSLQRLAKNFNGRSYDLDNPSDRLALKMNMLSVIRPQALKILEEVAAAYHNEFARPLPVSSLVRPEQYQHELRRVNRNAVTSDLPPMKNEGRIEVIRERNANYHVFVFVNGSRPSDDLISACLEKAGAPPPEEAHHAVEKPAKIKGKRSKSTHAGSNPRKTRKRHR